MKFTYLLALMGLLCLTSCASYIERIHQQIDQDEGVTSAPSQDQFEQFRGHPQMPRAQVAHPRFASPGAPSTASSSYMAPQVKRDYRPMNEAKKRYNTDDLADSQNEASLWTGNGKGNYLFGTVDDRRNGDIVLIQVAARLKNEITLELKRAFPEAPAAKKDPKEGEKADPAAPESPAAGPAPASAPAPAADEVYDRISSVIVEHINADHLLLRGRKHVLYKEHKRLIEVQALVARRDISNDDTVNSDRILETSIVVLR